MIANPDGLQSEKHDTIQSAMDTLQWILNPGAIHQEGMQSGFCNPASAILIKPVNKAPC